MAAYIWGLSGTDRQCDSYAPGHQIHWIHFNHSMREPSAVIPVTASIDDDGLVHIEGDDLSLVRWNHRPALLRAALERFGGRADWKPRWYLLAVPTESFMGSARSVFSLAALDERRDCRVTRTTNPDHLLPNGPAPTNLPDRLGPIWDQYSNRYSNPQRLRPPRWTSQMVNATEATTAIMSRIWVVIALIYR